MAHGSMPTKQNCTKKLLTTTVEILSAKQPDRSGITRLYTSLHQVNLFLIAGVIIRDRKKPMN
jgi:hypothetical protein